MIVRCRLRDLRGNTPLREMQRRTGIHRGTLSRIERGIQLPTAEQERAISKGYGGNPSEWYPMLVLAVEVLP